MARILFVANDFPYPPDHGAAVDMWNRISILKRLEFAVDLVATVKSYPTQEHINLMRRYVHDLWIVERNRGLSAVLTLDPFQVRSRSALRNVALKQFYDVVLMQTEYVAPILENVHLNAKALVLRVDNDEARYFKEMSKSANRWKDRYFYLTEALKFQRFSAQVKSRCDLLWFASDWEKRDHVQNHPEDSRKAVFFPPDPGISEMRPYSRSGEGVLFIGTLTIPFNLEAVKWYLEHVHPELSNLEGYTLTVAGRTDATALSLLRKMSREYSNVHLCPDPQELDGLYRQAAVFINPVRRGAGIKVKTIHALRSGLPVVATSIGMEGTGLTDGTHLLVADSAGDFVRGVSTLLQNRLFGESLVQSAQSFLARTYNQEHNIRQSLSSILPN